MTKKTKFITFVGAPNVGKSTLLNLLMDQKLSIVTPKAQTTRTSLKGIKIFGDTQLVLIDTPGLFSPKTYADKVMVDCALQMISGTDEVALLIDAKYPLTDANKKIIENIKKEKVPAILLINKIDQVKKPDLLAISSKLNELHNFSQTFMISALKTKGIDSLLDYLVSSADASPWPFSEDEITTAPLKFMISEIVREKIFLFTNKEIPYSTYVEVEHWKEQEKTDVIDILIRVRDRNHKKIILGTQGDLIKKIGTKARTEIEQLLNKKIFLRTHLKISTIDQIMQYKPY
jgi:GTP-binding protein Era